MAIFLIPYGHNPHQGPSKATSIALPMAISQHRSRHHNHHGKGNAVEIPHLVHLTIPQLKVAEADNDESRLRPYDHWLLITINEKRLLLAFLRKSHPYIYVQRYAGMNRSFKMLVMELRLHVLRVENL